MSWGICFVAVTLNNYWNIKENCRKLYLKRRFCPYNLFSTVEMQDNISIRDYLSLLLLFLGDCDKMELDYMEIGRNIRSCRREKGLKQKDLAEMVRVSDQHMSHIENGSTQLSLPTLIAVANALEIDCNTLLGQNLGKAQRVILRQELAEILDRVGGDEKKLRLRVNLCRLLEQYDQ